jgi:hypothetical protein
MIYLGEFKPGVSSNPFYGANFHSDQATLVDPTYVEAQLRSPSGIWTNLQTPTKQNNKTGFYGGIVSIIGFSPGQYTIRLSGTVATAKSVATLFSFDVVTNLESDVYSLIEASDISRELADTTILNTLGTLATSTELTSLGSDIGTVIGTVPTTEEIDAQLTLSHGSGSWRSGMILRTLPRSEYSTPTIYNGRDNRMVIQILANGVAADLSSLSRITLVEGTTVRVDSALSGAGTGQAIDWAPGNGIIVCYLGHELIPVGMRHLEFVLYDTSSPNGLRVNLSLSTVVVDGPVGTRFPAINLTEPITSGLALDTTAEYSLALGALAAGYGIDASGNLTFNGEQVEWNGDAVTFTP